MVKRAKGVEPAAAVKIVLRARQDLRDAMQTLANRHLGTNGGYGGEGNLSAEAKAAMNYWLRRHEPSQLHNTLLTTSIAVLITRMESVIGKSWESNATARAVIRRAVLQLVDHFLPDDDEHAYEALAANVKEESDFLLALLRHTLRTGPMPGRAALDDPDLAQIIQDKNVFGKEQQS